jgi:hypothetical protein
MRAFLTIGRRETGWFLAVEYKSLAEGGFSGTGRLFENRIKKSTIVMYRRR